MLRTFFGVKFYFYSSMNPPPHQPQSLKLLQNVAEKPMSVELGVIEKAISIEGGSIKNLTTTMVF